MRAREGEAAAFEPVREAFEDVGPEPSAFGHGGAGGQLAFCDPVNRVAMSFVRSCLEPQRWHAAGRLVDAVYGCLR